MFADVWLRRNFSSNQVPFRNRLTVCEPLLGQACKHSLQRSYFLAGPTPTLLPPVAQSKVYRCVYPLRSNLFVRMFLKQMLLSKQQSGWRFCSCYTKARFVARITISKAALRTWYVVGEALAQILRKRETDYVTKH